MERLEFSKMLVAQREAAGIGKNAMCRLTGFTFQQLQRIEGATNNFNFNLIVKYTTSLDKVLMLDNGLKHIKIKSFESFSDWLLSLKSAAYTSKSLATLIGVSRMTIDNIENKKNVVTVDNFLKIIDVLGYKVSLVDK